MRVFVTGASGYIGQAVAKAFRLRGHRVKGLVRSEEKGDALLRHEIEPVIGDLKDSETYKQEIEKAEVLVHAAFDYSGGGIDTDRLTIDTFLKNAAFVKLPKTFIYTSGVWVYGNTEGVRVDESFPLKPIKLVEWRVKHEEVVLNEASEHLRTVVVRPGCVYGGSGGLTGLWFQSASGGKLERIGGGDIYWSLIHVDDLAQAYVMIAEKELTGITLNICDDSSYTVRQMTDAIAKITSSKGISELTEKEALDKFGVLSQGLQINQLASGERLKRLTGWRPYHPQFLEGLQQYYHAWQANLR